MKHFFCAALALVPLTASAQSIPATDLKGLDVTLTGNAILFDQPPSNPLRDTTVQSVIMPGGDDTVVQVEVTKSATGDSYDRAGEQVLTDTNLFVSNVIDITAKDGVTRWIEISRKPADGQSAAPAETLGWSIWGDKRAPSPTFVLNAANR
jgi:hypothetical protein